MMEADAAQSRGLGAIIYIFRCTLHGRYRIEPLTPDDRNGPGVC